jgi:RES domain-containing protein
MLLYRIVHKSFSKNLFASGMKGRWNSAGNRVIYTAESIPLAFLENMVRRQGVGFNDDFQIMFIHIPEPVTLEIIDLPKLPDGWRDPNDYAACQALGDAWYFRRENLILRVPSAVMPECSNMVINTQHPDYEKVTLAGVTNLVPDGRIEDILKKYRVS